MDRQPLKALVTREPRQPLNKILVGLEMLDTRVGMEMLDIRVGIERLDTTVVMGMEMLDMMWNLWSSGHWVPLMMAFKPLVVLLRRQCNARLSALLFRKELLLSHVVVVHKIHCMTLGIRMTLGVLLGLVVPLASRPTIQSTRQVVENVRRHHGLLANRPLRTMAQKVSPLAMPHRYHRNRITPHSRRRWKVLKEFNRGIQGLWKRRRKEATVGLPRRFRQIGQIFLASGTPSCFKAREAGSRR